jgi:hypothetical protein
MRQRRDASELSLVIKNKDIREENGTNVLDVIIDRNLTWELQIDKICSKVSSSLFIILLLWIGIPTSQVWYYSTGTMSQKVHKKSFYITKKGD